MIMNEKELWDKYGGTQKENGVTLGKHTSFQVLNSRRHVLFSIARYKFARKMIGAKKEILDLGCSDGFGSYFLAEDSQKVVGVDFDEQVIADSSKNPAFKDIEFINDNFLSDGRYGEFDAITSFDVIEHIYPENESKYMQVILGNLRERGVAIIGTPSLEQNNFSKENIAGAHVNLYTGEKLEKMLNSYFHHVFMFTQNDEIIHTGYYRTANYLLAICCGKKL